MATLVNKMNREVKVIIPNMREFRVFYSDNEGSTMFFKRDWEEEKTTKQEEQVWSEEDEGELQNAIDALEFLGKKGVYKSESGYNAALQAAFWLKSLLERFNLQPNNEWSEEDRKMYKMLSSMIHGTFVVETQETQDKLLSWLKSLRPQSHWKPSEEQMVELNKVRTLNPGLDALYQQLKNM